MENNIAAIVVTYNRKKLLKECIESLLNQTITTDILIIDNASTDGTSELVKEYTSLDNFIYFNTGKNLGGAGGFQYGIKKATELGYDYVWIMDDDCIPTSSALEELVIAKNKLNDDFGYLSSKALWTDGSLCTMNVQKETLTKSLQSFSKEIIPVTMASFVSLFIPVSVIKDLGLPIKEFFIWADDWEYTRRISFKYNCYVVSKSVVLHKTMTNVGSNIALDSAERLPRYNFAYRNEIYFYRREGFKGWIYQSIRIIVHILKVLFKAKNNKLRRIKIILNGTKAGFKFNPPIEFVQGNGRN